MNRPSRFITLFSAFLLALSMAACGGGGGGDGGGGGGTGGGGGGGGGGTGGGGGGGGTTGTDFTVTSVAVTDKQGNALPAPELQIGHPSKVSLTITSNKAVDNVGVMLWIQDTLNNDDAGRLAVGATGFNLAAGTNTYTTEMLVPYTMPNVAPCAGADCGGEPAIDYNPIPAGEYFLFAQVDPANIIVETNEDNNVPASASFPTGAVIVDVRDDYANTPTVMLEEVVVDISDAAGVVLDVFEPLLDPQPDWCGRMPEFELDIEDIPNTTVGVTAVLNASGSFKALTEGVATAIPYVQVDATFDLADRSIPLEFWDSATGKYRKQLLVPDVEPGVSHAVYVDLLLDFGELEPLLNQGLSCQTQFDRGCSIILRPPYIDCSNLINACSPILGMLQDVQAIFGSCMDGPTIGPIQGYGPYTLPASFDDFVTCLDDSNQGINVTLTPLDSNYNVITDRFEPVGI
ncbi:MAG: hypothetical protein HKO55_00610, partial [Gammaproteobacteria bacterium]|nr:hypothetical protein [Gammaproteobacteria bacterium]